jgi:hypothetical protein
VVNLVEINKADAVMGHHWIDKVVDNLPAVIDDDHQDQTRRMISTDVDHHNEEDGRNRIIPDHPTEDLEVGPMRMTTTNNNNNEDRWRIRTSSHNSHGRRRMTQIVVRMLLRIISQWIRTVTANRKPKREVEGFGNKQLAMIRDRPYSKYSRELIRVASFSSFYLSMRRFGKLFMIMYSFKVDWFKS